MSKTIISENPVESENHGHMICETYKVQEIEQTGSSYSNKYDEEFHSENILSEKKVNISLPVKKAVSQETDEVLRYNEFLQLMKENSYDSLQRTDIDKGEITINDTTYELRYDLTEFENLMN